MRAGSGEWGGFGGGGSRTVGSTYLEHLQTSKKSTSYSRTPPFLVWKSAPEVGPERGWAADNVRLRAKYKFVSVPAQRVGGAVHMWTRSRSLEGPSRAQFVHMLAATYSMRAKGGWGHVRAAGAAAHRGFRTAGGRPGPGCRCCRPTGSRSPVHLHGARDESWRPT